MVSLLQMAFPMLYNDIDYNGRAHNIMTTIEKQVKFYHERQDRMEIVFKVSKHMIKSLIDESTDESFQEAKAFHDIFFKTASKEFDPVYIINEMLKIDVENPDQAKKVKHVHKLACNVFKERIDEIHLISIKN